MAPRRRFSRLAALGASVCVLAGLPASIAVADHYHECCGTPYATGHSLVHGGSTTDNVWHGRSTNNFVIAMRYCQAGADGPGVMGDSYANQNSTCQVMVTSGAHVWQGSEYCNSWGYENKGTTAGGNSPHYHYRHHVCANQADAWP